MLVLGKALLDIVQMIGQEPSPESFKLAWLILTVKPRFTMVRNKNLVNLYRLVQQINREHVPGAIVECGVWNGGCSAVMTYASRADFHHPQSRTVWLFDSFQGLPLPSAKDGCESQASYFEGMNKGNTENVRRVFGILGLSLDNVYMVPGWFEDTLASATVDQIALLHIDADWYESVKLALDTFYDRVVPGGFIALDDYNFWEGCNRALNDFLAEQQLTHVTLHYPNVSGVYFQKPA
jgi:O-methyltransferase